MLERAYTNIHATALSVALARDCSLVENSYQKSHTVKVHTASGGVCDMQKYQKDFKCDTMLWLGVCVCIYFIVQLLPCVFSQLQI